MTLPRSYYSDPANVAEWLEEVRNKKDAQCGECREREVFILNNSELVFCALKGGEYGHRCEHFRKAFKREEE